MCNKIIAVKIISFVFTSCFAQKSTTKENNNSNQPVITKGISTKLDSVNQLFFDNTTWKIGQAVSDEVRGRANIILTGNFFEIPIGDLQGFQENETQIGWNNQNRVIYISTTNKNALTVDKIGIGSTRKEILAILGTPYLSAMDRLRYQNLEYELQGILFYFSDDIVNRIVLFTGI